MHTKWIGAIQRVRGGGASAKINELRRRWVDEMRATLMGVRDTDPHASELREDFFYSLCRPAFHALQCGDHGHLDYILAIHFGLNEGDGLNDARNAVTKTKRPANTQWMYLLKAVAALASGKEAARRVLADLHADHGSGPLTIANPGIARAASDLRIGLGDDPFARPWREFVNRFWPVPVIDSNRAYYNLIRVAAFHPRAG